MARVMRDSKVAWIGAIPQHWLVVRGKDMLVERNERSKHGGEELLSVSTYTGIKPRREMIDADDSLSRADSLVDYKICYSGDIVINTMLAWNGSIGLSNYAGIVSPAYAVYKLRKEFEPKFVEYLLRSEATLIKIRAESRGINDARLRLYPDSLFAIQFGTPSYPEQRAIADYLDQQTTLIDQRLSTLEEKKAVLADLRKATIHEAVTKGLNKSAPMKDSGVAWFGEIPKDWEIKRLKSLLRESLTYGANEAADSNDPENPRFVRITDIDKNGNLREDTFRSLPLDIARQYLLKEGDVLLARSGATVGKSFIYQRSWGRCCFAGYLIRARLNPDVCVPKFFYACCQSTFYWQYISETQIQSTIQNVNAEKYANLYLPCPPIDEQLVIANHLDQQTQHIDAQLATLEEQAQVLKELRKAIIHEAVTGKIDLSGAVTGKGK